MKRLFGACNRHHSKIPSFGRLIVFSNIDRLAMFERNGVGVRGKSARIRTAVSAYAATSAIIAATIAGSSAHTAPPGSVRESCNSLRFSLKTVALFH